MYLCVEPGEGVEGEGCRFDIHLYKHLYGYMCLFLSLYRMFEHDMFT